MFKKKKVEKQEELPKAMLKMQQEKQEREEGNVRNNPSTEKYLAGKSIVKVIVVPGKIVNIVVKSQYDLR